MTREEILAKLEIAELWANQPSKVSKRIDKFEETQFILWAARWIREHLPAADPQ